MHYIILGTFIISIGPVLYPTHMLNVLNKKDTRDMKKIGPKIKSLICLKIKALYLKIYLQILKNTYIDLS